MISVYLESIKTVVFIDLGDLPLLNEPNWRARQIGNTTYLMRNDAAGRPVFLHRAIMEPGGSFVVDHIDGNGLNNSRTNLRVVTQAENTWNRIRPEKSFGVCWDKRRQQWRSGIGHRGKDLDIGWFDTWEEAIDARDYVSLSLRGAISPLNRLNQALSDFDFLKLSPSVRAAIRKERDRVA